MQRTVVVTGAGGYIGRHVVKVLCAQGMDVTAIGRHLNSDDFDAQVRIINKDILLENPKIYDELNHPDVCIHLAWKDGFSHNAESHMRDLSSHHRFLKHMIDGGLKHLVVMGTMHEIGYFEGAIDENTPCNPLSMYGIAKDSLRRSTFLLVKDKDVCLQWLRAYYIYGDDLKNHSIFTKLTEAANAGQTTFPFTSGKNKYDFIHVEELAKQIAATAMQTEVQGIINCCTGYPVSLAEKVEGFIKDKGFAIKLKYGAFPDRAYDSPGVWGDATKIRMILG